jgi:hypothetical protein
VFGRLGSIAVGVMLAIGGRNAGAAPPKLADADAAPCKQAVTWKDKGPTELEATEEPSGGRAFQTFECGDSWPVDIDWLDYASPAEVEWQAAWFRHRLWHDRDPGSTDIVRVMIKGPLLAIVVSAHPARMIAVLAKQGWTETTGVFPRHALAEPTDVDVRRWKKLVCDVKPEPGLEKLHEQRARYCAAFDAFAAGSIPPATRSTTATALRTTDGGELLAFLRLAKDDANFGTFVPQTEDEMYKARALLYTLQTREKTTWHNDLLDDLLKRAARKGQAPKPFVKTLAFEFGDRFVYVRKTATGLVAVSQSIAAGWDLVIAIAQ